MRRRIDISADELARRVGYEDRKTVERWENGESMPKPGVLPKLARELGVPLDTLRKLAGLDADGTPAADPLIAKLADDAADIERRLRALATASDGAPKAVTPRLKEDESRGRRRPEKPAGTKEQPKKRARGEG